MQPKLTIRLTAVDADNVLAIANSLRTDRSPFVNRSHVVKLALAFAAANVKQLLPKAGGVERELLELTLSLGEKKNQRE